MDLKQLLGEELYAQVAPVIANNADYTLIVDSKKEPTFIPKSRFDDVNTQRKQYKQQADDLVKQLDQVKESAKGNEKVIAELETVKNSLKAKDTEIQQIRIDAEVKVALKGANARNEKLVASLIDKSKLKVNENGEVEGLEDQLKALKESDGYLFDLEKGNNGGQGGKGGNGDDPNAGKPDGGTGSLGTGGKGGQGGSPETVGAALAKRKAEALKSNQNTNFFDVK